MKKILSGIFTATIIAAITFTSCSSPASGSNSPANGSNSSNNSSNDNQFSFDNFEPAALPQFQGENPLAGKTYADKHNNFIFTNNKITYSYNGKNTTDFDYSIDTTNNLIYVRFSKSYVLSNIKPQFESQSLQNFTPDEKEYWNEFVINTKIKSYSKISCYKYTLEGNNLAFTEAYSNLPDELKSFVTNFTGIGIFLAENSIYIETFDPYPHNQYWSKLSTLNGNFNNQIFFIASQNTATKKQGTFAGTISITTAQDPTQSKCTITFTQLPSEIPDSNSLLNTPLTLTPKCGKISAGTYTLQQ